MRGSLERRRSRAAELRGSFERRRLICEEVSRGGALEHVNCEEVSSGGSSEVALGAWEKKKQRIAHILIRNRYIPGTTPGISSLDAGGHSWMRGSLERRRSRALEMRGSLERRRPSCEGSRVAAPSGA